MSDYKIGQKPLYVKPPEFTLDFKVLNEPLRGAFRTIRDRLKDEEPDPYGFHFLLRMLVTTAMETHAAVVRLLDQTETKQFAFQAKVLVRIMMDSLFTIVALKTDPPKYSRVFDLAGYRATWKRHQREKAQYGSDPRWKDHLEEQQKFLNHRAAHGQLSDQEKNDPEHSCPIWPTPARMLRPRQGEMQFPFSKGDREFLTHVETWHYGDVSSQSHMQWAGMALSVYAADREEQWIPGMLESNVAIESVFFVLMLLSEVEAIKKYETNQTLRYLWGILGEAFDDAKDYYKMRYQHLLA